MYSVLQNTDNIQFKSNYFPYIVIDDALPLELYNMLKSSLPSSEKIIGNNEYHENFAYRYNANNSLKDKDISNEWKEFIKYHTSYNFLEEFYNILGDSIKKIYKVEKEKLFNENNVGVRFEKKNFFWTVPQFKSH